MIVAIDGPAGSGKGTITKNVERKLGFLNLDTGATYRCVALETLRNNLRLDQETEIIKIAKIKEHYQPQINIFPQSKCKQINKTDCQQLANK